MSTASSRCLEATVLAVVALAVSCGGPRSGETRAGGETQPVLRRAPTKVDDDGPLAPGVRRLPARSRWSTLVRLAARLEEQRSGDSREGCVLRRSGSSGWQLAADLAAAIRPLPVVTDDLDAVLAAPGSIGILSRWGNVGITPQSPPALLLADFTTSSPPTDGTVHVVLAITDDGIAVRAIGGTSRRGQDAELEEMVTAVIAAQGTSIVHVIAEAEVSLRRVAQLLTRLDGVAQTEITLAAALPAGTRPPPERAAAPPDDGAGLCPDGLPETEPSLPDAALDGATIARSLGPLRDAAQTCFEEAASGGVREALVLLAMRIDGTGAVPEACVRADAARSSALRSCLMSAARGIAFPPAGAPGSVVVEIPLRMRARPGPAQRAICE